MFYISRPSVINAIAALYESLDYETLNKADLYNPESIMHNFLLANKIELLNISGFGPTFGILRTKYYKALRGSGWVENGPAIEQASTLCYISEDEYKRLKKLGKFSGFVKFYTHKQLVIKPKRFFAKIRRKTRAVRYPIKRFFGFGEDKKA